MIKCKTFETICEDYDESVINVDQQFNEWSAEHPYAGVIFMEYAISKEVGQSMCIIYTEEDVDQVIPENEEYYPDPEFEEES